MMTTLFCLLIVTLVLPLALLLPLVIGAAVATAVAAAVAAVVVGAVLLAGAGVLAAVGSPLLLLALCVWLLVKLVRGSRRDRAPAGATMTG